MFYPNPYFTKLTQLKNVTTLLYTVSVLTLQSLPMHRNMRL